MRFLSIAAFVGLVAASHISVDKLEIRDSRLHSRAVCGGGQGANSSGQCVPCSPNMFGAGGFNAVCQACPAGAQSDSGATSCSCKPGFYVGGGRTYYVPCNACLAGTTSSAGSSSCYSCAANTYSTGGGTCNACPNGSTSSAGSSFCSCAAGSYWSSGSCRACAAGSYSSPGATSCTTCPADNYSGDGAGSCTPCPSGSGSGSGSSSPSQCVSKCSSGQIFDANGCSNCPAGTYSSNNMCAACPAGTISNPGSTTCAVCPGGSVPAANRQSCSTCPAETFSSGDNCASCPAGSTSSPGSSSCGPRPSQNPQPSFRSVSQMCQGEGYMRCDVFTGMGGSECINVMTTLDSCGGCVGPEGEEYKYSGRDCSAIPNVNEVKCQAGRCDITSCRDGYEPSGGFCAPSAGATKNTTVHRSRSVKRDLSARHNSF